MNINEFKQVFPALAKAEIVPLILGDKGIGKSEVTRQISDSFKGSFFDFRTGICSDAGDIKGLPFKVTNEQGVAVSTGFLPPNELPRGGEGIFFIDEINRGNKEVLQALFQLVLDRKVGEYVLPEGWSVVAAMNPPTEDYQVNDFDDAAFLDRFCQIKLEPTVEEWAQHAKTKPLSPELIEWIRETPQFLKAKMQDFSIKATPSPRSVTRFGILEEISSKLKIPEHLVKEMGYGMIGIEAISSYYTYKRDNTNKAFTAEDILNDFPKNLKKVQEYSSLEKNRNDLLQVTNENLVEFLEKNVPTKEQETNFTDYFCAIPKDLALGFYQSHLLINKTIRDNFQKSYTDPADSLFGGEDGITARNPNTLKIFEEFKNTATLLQKNKAETVTEQEEE